MKIERIQRKSVILIPFLADMKYFGFSAFYKWQTELIFTAASVSPTGEAAYIADIVEKR